MTKILSTTIMTVAVLTFAIVSPAIADPRDFIPPGHQYGGSVGDTTITVKPKIKTNVTNLVSQKTMNLNTNINTNKAYGGEGGKGGAGGAGGNATIEKGAIRNTNNNDVKSTAIQGQKQEATATQGQKQTVNNQDTVIITDNTVVEDNREFIQAPVHGAPDARLVDNVQAFELKADGGRIFNTMAYITYEDAMHVAKDCDDYKIQRATLRGGGWTSNGIDNLDVALDAVHGDFKGYMTLSPTGDDVDVDACMGRIIQKAMKEGFTGYKVYRINKGEAAVGDSTNISLGSGASVITKGQDLSVGGTSGLGWSGAEGWKEFRAEIKIEVFLNR